MPSQEIQTHSKYCVNYTCEQFEQCELHSFYFHLNETYNYLNKQCRLAKYYLASKKELKTLYICILFPTTHTHARGNGQPSSPPPNAPTLMVPDWRQSQHSSNALQKCSILWPTADAFLRRLIFFNNYCITF